MYAIFGCLGGGLKKGIEVEAGKILRRLGGL